MHPASVDAVIAGLAGLMTGMYPQRTGLLMSYRWQGVNPNMRTMGHYFAEAGYATGLIGKWHLEGGSCDNVQAGDNEPNKMGFQEVVKAPALTDYWNREVWKDGQQVKPDGRYIRDVLTDEAVDFINRHKTNPFFLYLAYTSPHFPLQSRPEGVTVFQKAGCTEGESITSGMVRREDYGVGRLIQTLEQLGLADNMLVVFTSDNGPFLGVQDSINQDRYNAHLCYGKGLINEGGIRVPAIVRWPERLGKPPRVCRDFNHFVDWLPTLLSAAGIVCPAHPQIDGENLLPGLCGEKERIGATRFWAWSWSRHRIDSNAAMREGDWKLVRPFLVEQSGCCPNPPMTEEQMPKPLPLQLFNLETDPSESNDLAALFPERVERMKRELQAWFESVMTDFERASEWLKPTKI